MEEQDEVDRKGVYLLGSSGGQSTAGGRPDEGAGDKNDTMFQPSVQSTSGDLVVQ